MLTYGQQTQIKLRHLTKKGKPRKTISYYGFGLVKCIKPLGA